MRAFQKAGQFQLSSVSDGLLAQRRHEKKSTDSCSSTSSLTMAVVPNLKTSSSTLPHTRRLCGSGVCRCRHAPCPPSNTKVSLSLFDFSEERLAQLIDQCPFATTTTAPKQYGMTLRSRAAAAINNHIPHEFASPAPPPPLLLVPSLSFSSSSSSISSSSLSSTTTDVIQSTIIYCEKRPLASSTHHTSIATNKRVKRSGTIIIND